MEDMKEQRICPRFYVDLIFDTVPNGGYFDGLTGIMTALEAVSILKEEGIRTRRPIEIVALLMRKQASFWEELLVVKQYVEYFQRIMWVPAAIKRLGKRCGAQ